MKKILILALVVVLFSCNRQNGFQIKVNLEGAEGQLLFEQRGTDAWIPVDTADIVNGVAILEGIVDFPVDYYLSVLGQRAKMIVFVENTKIQITGKVDSLENATVTGSKTHDEYKIIESQIKEISEKYMALYQQSREAAAQGDNAKAEELMEQVEEIFNSTDKLQEDFVRNNPASFVTPFILEDKQYSMEAETLDVLVSNLDPKLDVVPFIMVLKEHLEILRTVAIGKTAPDFTQNDPDGNPVKLSDIYSQNELTLVDFWAAWCGPCRVENPNIVAVYNEFKDKGFGILGVSLDRTKEDWLKAIEDDKLTWAHVSDLSYWQNSAAQLYGINSIPSSLLVDKNGKIVAKNMRGDELRTTVADFLD